MSLGGEGEVAGHGPRHVCLVHPPLLKGVVQLEVERLPALGLQRIAHRRLQLLLPIYGEDIEMIDQGPIN